MTLLLFTQHKRTRKSSNCLRGKKDYTESRTSALCISISNQPSAKYISHLYTYLSTVGTNYAQGISVYLSVCGYYATK